MVLLQTSRFSEWIAIKTSWSNGHRGSFTSAVVRSLAGRQTAFSSELEASDQSNGCSCGKGFYIIQRSVIDAARLSDEQARDVFCCWWTPGSLAARSGTSFCPVEQVICSK